MTITSKLSIVFTDSGLGGLSIMSLFLNKLKTRLHDTEADEVELIFFNALPENGQGYNKMSSMQQKVDTFNKALERIELLYEPSTIAIACNTLSAVYPLTSFARQNKNTFEIISSGRYLINQQHLKQPQYPIFVIATPTTIWSGAYEMHNPQVMHLSGASLASQIEIDHSGGDVMNTLATIFKKIKTLTSQKEIVLFLGCTHYGYIEDLFLSEAKKYQLDLIRIINPNVEFSAELIDAALPTANEKRKKTTQVNLRIESQALIDPAEIKSIKQLLISEAPEIVDVLEDYTQLPKSI